MYQRSHAQSRRNQPRPVVCMPSMHPYVWWWKEARIPACCRSLAASHRGDLRFTCNPRVQALMAADALEVMAEYRQFPSTEGGSLIVDSFQPTLLGDSTAARDGGAAAGGRSREVRLRVGESCLRM